MKKQKALNRLAAALAVLLALCLVFIAPVGATTVSTSEDLKSAFAGGGEVTLGADIELTETLVVPSSVTVILDLNGHSISMEDSIISTTYAINNLGTLTLKDSSSGKTGSVNARGIYNGYGGGGENPNVATAKITVESGTYNAEGTNGGGAAIFNYGIAEIKGGTFTSVSSYSLNNQIGASMTVADSVTVTGGIYNTGATLTVNGGDIKNSRSGAHVIYAWNSQVTIKNGNIYNENSGNAAVFVDGTTDMIINGGTFGIKDGSQDGKDFTSYLLDTTGTAVMTVTSGTFNGGFRVNGASAMMNINGGSFNNAKDGDSGNVGGSGYSISGKLTITGGSFTDDDAKNFVTNNGQYLGEGCTLGNDGKINAPPQVAKIERTGTTYSSLAAAVEAAKAGDTVTLLKDIEDLPATIKIEKKLTITGGDSKKSITTTSQKRIFEVYADADFENLNLVNKKYDGRCIDTRVGGITVNVKDCDLTATNKDSNYTQPLTIGGNGKDAAGNEAAKIVVNLNKVNIEAKHYGIIIFNPVDLDITNSKISGYSALYFKGEKGAYDESNKCLGSATSTVDIVNSELISENKYGGNSNDFATVVFEDTGVTINLISSDIARAYATGDADQGLFSFSTHWWDDENDDDKVDSNELFPLNGGKAESGNVINVGSDSEGSESGLILAEGNTHFIMNELENKIRINEGVVSNFIIPENNLVEGCVCIESESTVGGQPYTYKVVAKDYTIEASVEKVGFDSVKVGYTQPEPQIVTITNDGNVPVTIEASISGNYDISVDKTVLSADGADEKATLTIKPIAGLAVGNYEDKLTITVKEDGKSYSIPVSFLVYQPSSGGSSKPVEEPEEPVVEPEVPTEEPEAGEATVETEVTDGGEVEFEAPVEEPGVEGGSAAADEDEAKITGVVLPTGTDSEVTFVPVSEQAAPAGKETQTKKVFEINVPTYEKGKPATIKFTMTVAELEADGKEAADVALWHFDEETGEWTKLVTSYTIVDGIVYFEAITNDFSPFAIVYEDEPVDEPVDEPETPASPAPVLGLIAALGAAVALRRK